MLSCFFLLGEVWIWIMLSCIAKTKCQSCGWGSYVTPLEPSSTNGWAVGTPAEIQITVTGSVVNGERFSWILNGTAVSQLQYLLASNDFMQTVPFDRGTSNATISNKDGSSSVILSLKFDAVELTDNEIILVAEKQICSNSFSPEFLILTSYCDNLSKSSGLFITGGENASFNDIATYNCSFEYSWIMIDGVIMKSTYTHQLVCMGNAEWNETTNVTCAYPPTHVNVTQTSFYANDSAQLKCQHTPGYPGTTNETFFFGKTIVPRNVLLEPDHYLKNYYCEVHNLYTDSSEKPARSGNGTLIVFFSPYDLNQSDDKYVEANETAEVFFAFRANPNGSIYTNFTSPSGYRLEELNYSVIIPGSHVFNYSITLNSSSDYGKYTFTAKTTDPPGSINGSINIMEPVTSTGVIPTTKIGENKVDISVIAGVCAGIFIVVLILVLLIVFKRRREKEMSDAAGVKEERDNPLYGTSVGAKTVVTEKKGESFKEERENPLYSSSAVSPVEEAYAAVDTRKKNTSKGNDNVAFSTESSAVVYAAVDKPKKRKKNDVPPVEAVYTEVNKKKR